MSNLNDLEHRILAAVIGHVCGGQNHREEVDRIEVEERKFSSVDDAGNCSGFYSKLRCNSLLRGAAKDISKHYCVPAKNPILQSEEMGFMYFAIQSKSQ